MATALPLVMHGTTARTASDSARACFERYRNLINTHDFERLAQVVIADDAVFVFSDKRHEGLDAVRRSFLRSWFILPDEIYDMSSPVWIIEDTRHAACRFAYSYRGTLSDGSALQGGGQGINLFRRDAGGWRIMYEQLTPDTAVSQ